MIVTIDKMFCIPTLSMQVIVKVLRERLEEWFTRVQLRKLE